MQKMLDSLSQAILIARGQIKTMWVAHYNSTKKKKKSSRQRHHNDDTSGGLPTSSAACPFTTAMHLHF